MEAELKAHARRLDEQLLHQQRAEVRFRVPAFRYALVSAPLQSVPARRSWALSSSSQSSAIPVAGHNLKAGGNPSEEDPDSGKGAGQHPFSLCFRAAVPEGRGGPSGKKL